MEKHILIGIRYSIIQLGGKSWAASRTTPEQYVNSILSNSRLDVRELTFKNITIRSLADQTYDSNIINLSILIMVSELLPTSRIEPLNSILESLPSNIRVIVKSIAADAGDRQHHADYTNINQAMQSTMRAITTLGNPAMVCTVRLDDDDGLSVNFVAKLASHMNKGTAGYACSFAHGFEGYYDQALDQISHLKHSYFPKNAVGLAYFNEIDNFGNFVEERKIHIYNLGNHTKIDEHTPTLVDSSAPMYFKSINKTNDNGGSIHHKYLPSVNGISSLVSIPLVAEKLQDYSELSDTEDLTTLEISKSGGALLALTKLLNERIQLREKQLREAISKKSED
jgi:hypothetical protein